MRFYVVRHRDAEYGLGAAISFTQKDAAVIVGRFSLVVEW